MQTIEEETAVKEAEQLEQQKEIENLQAPAAFRQTSSISRPFGLLRNRADFGLSRLRRA